MNEERKVTAAEVIARAGGVIHYDRAGFPGELSVAEDLSSVILASSGGLGFVTFAMRSVDLDALIAAAIRQEREAEAAKWEAFECPGCVGTGWDGDVKPGCSLCNGHGKIKRLRPSTTSKGVSNDQN